MADAEARADRFAHFKDAASSASDKIEDHAADLKDGLGPTAEKVFQFAKDRPVTSILLALAAGMLIARRL